MNGANVTTYVVDFEITHHDGSIELLEVKGVWNREAILKRKLFQAVYLSEHKDIKYTVIK